MIGLTRYRLSLLAGLALLDYRFHCSLLPVFYAFFRHSFLGLADFLSKTGIVPVADAPVPDSRALRAIS